MGVITESSSVLMENVMIHPNIDGVVRHCDLSYICALYTTSADDAYFEFDVPFVIDHRVE